jgi:rod shape-determining protein MreD
MVLRLVLLAGCLVAGAVADGAWFWRLPMDVGPDLLLLVVLSVGLRSGFESGAIAGAAAGYLRDLITGGPLGVFMLAYLVIGGTAGAARPMVDLHQRAMPAAAAMAGTAVLALVSGVIVTVTGVAGVSWPALAADAGIGAALSALFAGWVDALVRAIDRFAERRYSGRVIGHRVLR